MLEEFEVDLCVVSSDPLAGGDPPARLQRVQRQKRRDVGIRTGGLQVFHACHRGPAGGEPGEGRLDPAVAGGPWEGRPWEGCGGEGNPPRLSEPQGDSSMGAGLKAQSSVSQWCHLGASSGSRPELLRGHL